MLRREALAGGEVVRYRMARTVLGRPVYVASCYLVGPRTLVDAGTPRNAPELLAALPADGVRSILLTHGHEDHAGNAGRFPRAEVRGAPGLRLARDIPWYRRFTWGEPGPAPPVLPADGAPEAKDLRLRPVPTPGHTPDHLAWWEPDRGWLFAGDAALGPLKYGFRDEDILAYLDSLKAMRALRPEVVFPSHGPVLDRPAEQLGAQVARLEGLRDEARRLAREGLGEAAITRRLLGFDGALGAFSGGEFSKRTLVRGLLRDPAAARGGPR